MTQPQWHPGKILELSGVYWQTCTLHAAVKLGVFTAINGERIGAKEAARRIGGAPDATGRLLDALTAMGLIEKTAGGYANTEAAARFLTTQAPGYIGHMIMHHHHLMESWNRLDEAVISGKPVRTRAIFDDPVRRESFLMGMFNNAMLQAPALVKEVDLAGRRHLLDMGGGPGTYAIHFCRQNPQLEATVMDLAATRPFAEKTIALFGLADRIAFVDGDYTCQDIVGRFDVVWMSHILHGESPGTCRQMVQKAVAALEPGGLILIHEFILNDDLSGPLFPALFSLNMLVGTDGGRSYSDGQLRGMLQDAGVTDIARLPFCGPTQSGIIAGKIPTSASRNT
jgi:predicted O-methyltransferase YrrM